MEVIEENYNNSLISEKFREHERYSIWMTALTGLTGASLWFWDYVIDPQHAEATVPFRLLTLLAGLLPLATKQLTTSRTTLSAALIITPLLWVALYFPILLKLDDGMIYGIGGFMYFQMMGILLLQCLRFPSIAAYHVAAAAFPHLLALLIPDTGFQHDRYAVLIWPATIMALIAQYGLHKEYAGRQALKQEIQQAAITDALTGAYNRRHFSHIAAVECALSNRKKIPLCIILADIDHFKKLNDTLGHTAGDHALKEVCAALRQAMRTSDLLFRWGGEEFLVLAPGTDLVEGVTLAERLRRASESIVIPQHGPVTLSLGIAELGDGTMEDLIASADNALYAAKRNGRNRVESASA